MSSQIVNVRHVLQVTEPNGTVYGTVRQLFTDKNKT
jgi:hypothetical protein